MVDCSFSFRSTLNKAPQRLLFGGSVFSTCRASFLLSLGPSPLPPPRSPPPPPSPRLSPSPPRLSPSPFLSTLPKLPLMRSPAPKPLYLMPSTLPTSPLLKPQLFKSPTEDLPPLAFLALVPFLSPGLGQWTQSPEQLRPSPSPSPPAPSSTAINSPARSCCCFYFVWGLYCLCICGCCCSVFVFVCLFVYLEIVVEGIQSISSVDPPMCGVCCLVQLYRIVDFSPFYSLIRGLGLNGFQTRLVRGLWDYTHCRPLVPSLFLLYVVCRVFRHLRVGSMYEHRLI